MWGWHLLSPIGPFGDGVTYSDTKTTKAIVMVTDGKNDVGGGSNGFNKSVFSAYGYADNGNNPHLNSTDPEGVLDQKFLTLCSHIKALKDENGNPRVLLYVIGLGTDVNTNLLQQCPTDSSMYFTNTTTAQLITTFQNIALGLNKLRVSK